MAVGIGEGLVEDIVRNVRDVRNKSLVAVERGYILGQQKYLFYQ